MAKQQRLRFPKKKKKKKVKFLSGSLEEIVGEAPEKEEN
jgi:hypothetical protein